MPSQKFGSELKALKLYNSANELVATIKVALTYDRFTGAQVSLYVEFEDGADANDVRFGY